jgi:opacity protein-like surface antigen
MKSSIRCKKAIVAIAMLMATSSAMGASESSASDWQYGLSIYLWLPSVSGDLNYSPPGSGSGIEVDPSQILDNLEMAFMGSFEARKGKWSGFTDVIYLDLSGDKTKSVNVPNGTTLTLFDADMDLTAWVWTLGGSYTVWRSQKSHLDLLAGARLLSLDTELRLTGGGPLQSDRTLSESENLWDGIIGAKGSIALNERWFLPYYVDVGTGDTELTWQAIAGIGYAFHWGQVILKYRYLAYDQGSDELLQDIAFGGAQLGVGFRF